MPTRLVSSSRRPYFTLLFSALLLFLGLLVYLLSTKKAAILRHQVALTSHFAALQQHSRIQKSATARRPKRVLVVKPTANDQL
jgi:hypothetical protein